MYDVIVVGGGPIGSYTAGRLAEKGHRVLVLEKKAGAGDGVCCTGIVGMECVNAFNIPESLILRQVNGATLFPPSVESLAIRREEPQAAILDRAAFDIAMAEQAQKNGAEYAFNRRVTDVNPSSDLVTVSVSVPDKEEKYEAKAAVIAAGFAPSLLRHVGLGAYGDFTVGVQVEMEVNHADNVEVYFGSVAPGFFAWIVPTTPPMARIGLLMRKSPGKYLQKWLEALANEGRISLPAPEPCYGAIPLKSPPRTYSERLLVVGDAAGHVKPTSGGGIYYGLLGADIAVSTLHDALTNGNLSARRLSRYQQGWKKRLGRELTVGYWARKLFERLSEKQIDRTFAAMKLGNIDQAMLRASDLSFDWHSRTIIRLLKYQVIARTSRVFRLPPKLAGVDRQRE